MTVTSAPSDFGLRLLEGDADKDEDRLGTAPDSTLTMVERLIASVLPQGRLTLTVEETGEIIGLGRSAAYEAAKRGDFPTRKIGRRIVVPVPALLTWLGARCLTPEAG